MPQANTASLFEIFEEEKKEISSIKERVNSICEKHNIEDAELFYMIRCSSECASVPVEIFSQNLSPLEAVVSYLKRNYGMKYCDIAKLLNRDERTIWVTYNNSVSKQKTLLLPKKSKIIMPLKIFSKKKLSILETIVLYLSENKEMKLTYISTVLKKNTSTVWTALQRARKKGGVTPHD